MIISCGISLFFGFFNIYNFLYRQAKYKEITNVIIYIAAILCLVLNIAYVFIVPSDDYCTLNWFLTAYFSAYCDLIVGICQSYLLAMLNKQLQCLWEF